MERHTVDSSQVASVGYDHESQTLEVEFTSGALYQYFGVPADVYDGLLAAESAGRYLNSSIKGVYDYERV